MCPLSWCGRSWLELTWTKSHFNFQIEIRYVCIYIFTYSSLLTTKFYTCMYKISLWLDHHHSCTVMMTIFFVMFRNLIKISLVGQVQALSQSQKIKVLISIGNVLGWSLCTGACLRIDILMRWLSQLDLTHCGLVMPCGKVVSLDSDFEIYQTLSENYWS